MDNQPSFLRNHADTLAIIGVNLGIAAIGITMIFQNCDRIDAVNGRIDALNARSDSLYQMVYDIVKEGRK